MSDDTENQAAQSEAAPETPAAEAPAQDAPAEPKKKPWYQSKIDELTGKYHGTQRAVQERDQRISALEQALRDASKQQRQDPTPQDQDVNQIREQIRHEERTYALQSAAVDKFNQTCNDIAARGKAEFKDFDDSVKSLRDIDALSPEMIISISKKSNPHAIVHYWGKNLDEAMRIKQIADPDERAEAIAEIAQKLKAEVKPSAPKSRSSAPEPITPVGGPSKGDVDIYDDNITMDQFIRMRDKQESDRRKSGR
jgi:hypothetical protein